MAFEAASAQLLFLALGVSLQLLPLMDTRISCSNKVIKRSYSPPTPSPLLLHSSSSPPNLGIHVSKLKHVYNDLNFLFGTTKRFPKTYFMKKHASCAAITDPLSHRCHASLGHVYFFYFLVGYDGCAGALTYSLL